LKRELDGILDVYQNDNCSAWDCGPDGTYVRRSPPEGEECRAAQESFIQLAQQDAKTAAPRARSKARQSASPNV